MSTPPTDPAAWTALVEHHTRRLIAEGVDPADARPQAVELVDDYLYDDAYKIDAQIGPRHHRDAPDDVRAACGLRVGILGVRAFALHPWHIRCEECREEIDRRIAFGRPDIPHGMGPAGLRDARIRYAQRYLASNLGVPDWAMPAATQGTPLHALSVQVRTMAARRNRMAGRVEQALKTQQGQLERARAPLAEGRVPSWTLLEPDTAVETAATAEGLRVLDKVLAEMAAVLTLTCTQVNRWLKAEGVTGEPAGELAVIAAACDWRDLRNIPVAGRIHADTNTALVDAVDAYRRGLRVVLDVPVNAVGCTHGGDCTVHPEVQGLHDFTPTAAAVLGVVLDAAQAGPVDADDVRRIADRLGVAPDTRADLRAAEMRDAKRVTLDQGGCPGTEVQDNGNGQHEMPCKLGAGHDGEHRG
jgi:hypothetical protein